MIIQQYFPGYHGVVWYWRAFSCQLKSYLQGQYLLRFGMVDFAATVWINGQLIGKSKEQKIPLNLISQMRLTMRMKIGSLCESSIQLMNL